MKKVSTTLPLLCLLIPGVSTPDHGDDDGSRAIVVSGAGDIDVQPDMATVSMGVQALEREPDEARAQVIRAVASFLDITRELDIEDKYVQTSQLTVRPEYRWNPKNQQQHLIGYFVERQLNVELRDLDKLGLLMEKAVSAGVNVVSGPQFGSSREDALRRRALKRAALDARASGTVLAETLGARLGPLRQITASSIGYLPPVMPYAMAKAEVASVSDAAQTYEAGQIEITAQVTARFDLLIE